MDWEGKKALSLFTRGSDFAID